MGKFDIEYYHDYISEPLADYLLEHAKPVEGVSGLCEVGDGGGLETREAFLFLVRVYRLIKEDLKKVLLQRDKDRKFIDERVRVCSQFNNQIGRDILSPEYQTIIGLEDTNGRIVVGPLTENYARPGGSGIAPIPDFLKGPHVTLFGPPDSAKMSINAMNAYHRKIPNEPKIVAELLSNQELIPKWGADDEDSKTPLRKDLVDAGINLTSCFERDIEFEDKKKYKLADDHLSLPIKRFPGLALPSTFLFYEGSPIPLHIYDFTLHLFRNWQNPQALTFYVPKLENEEEAKYIHTMISVSEKLIKEEHPEYKLGTVRVMVVLENPRAILRTHEIMDALYPYFVGASLGWHDYLGSMARLFKEDGNYRIPVKADPNIVIKHIKASHSLLADVVGSRGGIKVGGMYGILPLGSDTKSLSFQVTLLGFIKDVVTQLKRDLTGFWVAHPDFVRLGLALVEAWRRHIDGDSTSLRTLVSDLLSPQFHAEIIEFVFGEDIESLDKSDPNYVRKLLVADIKESDFIPNNHPDEIRYNVFQTLQYLTDWLSGNGCVALPAIVSGTPVRVMDDLATAERSRWEVWHEVYHGRFSKDELVKIAHEEMHFIRKDLSNDKKIVQVKYSDKTKKWYPVAFQIMLKLMTDRKPPEFATELLMPFTVESVRRSNEPLKALWKIEKDALSLDSGVSLFNRYFEACGCFEFAKACSRNPVLDYKFIQDQVLSFSLEEIKESAYFHGNIGESEASLDSSASSEQSEVLKESEAIRKKLRELGNRYLLKFGFKFLVSAKGKSALEILEILQRRFDRSVEEELHAAREALLEITEKRLRLDRPKSFSDSLLDLLNQYEVPGVSIAISKGGHRQEVTAGWAHIDRDPVLSSTEFQYASLSKTIGTAIALEFFREHGVAKEQFVNSVLSRTSSDYRLEGEKADIVTIKNLLNHTALNLHYVSGFEKRVPDISELMSGRHGYERLELVDKPGEKFSYSGGGFLVLQHIVEAMSGEDFGSVAEVYLRRAGVSSVRFYKESNDNYATGYMSPRESVSTGHLNFPAIAAGASGTAADMARLLRLLAEAYSNVNGSAFVSHDTAVDMLYGEDRGSKEFMGCLMGLGVFIGEAGDNKLMIHQGANDGFRALFIYCFSGPNSGDGFVILANGSNSAVSFISKVAQTLILETKIKGIDVSRFKENFDMAGINQNNIVNFGYKELVFDAFLDCLPEVMTPKIKNKNADKNLANFATIERVSNQKFGCASNLISPFDPEFDPEAFCHQGKTMDSWETERHSIRGRNEIVLAWDSDIEFQYVTFSTKYHDGNHVSKVGLIVDNNLVLEETELEGHSELNLKLSQPCKTNKLTIVAFPDGGLTRVGLYKEPPEEIDFDGVSKKCNDPIPKTKRPLSLSFEKIKFDSKEYLKSESGEKELVNYSEGGIIVSATNEHYGSSLQVISPFAPIHMFDGFESARSREHNHHEELVLKLKAKSQIRFIDLDFKFFINNAPIEMEIDFEKEGVWSPLFKRFRVKEYSGNTKRLIVDKRSEVEKLRFKFFPDGGINRIRVY